MNRKTIRSATLALAACATVAAIGCDPGESASLNQQANAMAVRLSGGDGVAVAAELTSAASGSMPVNVQAQQLLAQSRLSDARALADALRIKQSQADALVARISTLASLAGVTATRSSTFKQLDPKATTALIADMSAKARGDGNVLHFTELPNGSIPTLAAVKQEKSRLEGEIAKATSELQAATLQRNELLTRVGTLAAQVDEQRGESKLATVRQAADLRQQAAVVSRTIGELESSLERRRSDLGVQTMLETQLDSAVKSFDAQRAALDTGWMEINAKASEQSKFAQSILAADAGENPNDASVKMLSGQLVELLKEVNDLREQTLTAYDDSVSKFDAAKIDADKFVARISPLISSQPKPAESAAWEALKGTLDGDRFNLQKAIAKREQASVHTSHAQFLLHAASTAGALEEIPEELNAAVPEPFDSAKLKAQASEAVGKSDELLTESLGILDGIQASGASVAAILPLKYSNRIFANYDRALLSQLALASGMTLEVAKEQVYTDAVANAKAAIVEARGQSILVPSVPTEIYVEAPKVVEEKPAETAPTDQPADEPAIAAIRTALSEFVTSLINPELDEAGIDGLLVRLKTDEASAPLLAEIKSVLGNRIKVRAAIKSKFAELSDAFLTTHTADTSAAIEKAIKSLKIEAADETNATATAAVGGTYKLVKEEDVWKLDLTGLSAEQSAAGAIAGMVLKPLADSYAQFQTDIESGKYASFEEFETAWKGASEPAVAVPADGAAAQPPATDTVPQPPAETPPADEQPSMTPAEGVKTPEPEQPAPEQPAPAEPAPATPAQPPADPPVQP